MRTKPKRRGRPPKKPGDRYVAILVKFPPSLLAELEQLRNRYARGMPRAGFLRAVLRLGVERAKRNVRLPKE